MKTPKNHTTNTWFSNQILKKISTTVFLLHLSHLVQYFLGIHDIDTSLPNLYQLSNFMFWSRFVTKLASEPAPTHKPLYTDAHVRRLETVWRIELMLLLLYMYRGICSRTYFDAEEGLSRLIYVDLIVSHRVRRFAYSLKRLVRRKNWFRFILKAHKIAVLSQNDTDLGKKWVIKILLLDWVICSTSLSQFLW